MIDVSDLGEVLELMQGAHARWEYAYVAFREWRDQQRAMAAFEQARRERPGNLQSVVIASSSEVAPVYESVSRVWIDRPHERSRIESQDGYAPSLSITVGNRWWMYHPRSGAVSNENDPGIAGGATSQAGQADLLLDPSPLLTMCELTVLGHQTVAGRREWRLRAVNRRYVGRLQSILSHPLVGPAGEERELVVDAELGVLLRWESRFQGEPFSLAEVPETA